MEPTKYGESNLKRRLQAFGLDSDAINAFPIPRSPKDAGNDAYNLSGTNVAVYLVDEEYLGKPTKRVRAVFPIG
jgi:transposase